MDAKQYLFNEKQTISVKDEVVVGCCSLICSTMTPNGRFINIAVSDRPTATKDGVTVAKAIRYEEQEKDMIAQSIAQASIRTDEVCGDGTTTTAWLLWQFYEEFKSDLNFVKRKRIEALTTEALGYLKQLTTEVDISNPLLRDALMTTSNHDEEIVNKVLEIFGQQTNLPEVILKEGIDAKDEYVVNPSLRYVAQLPNLGFTKNGQGTPETHLDYYPLVFNCELKDLHFEENNKHIMRQFFPNDQCDNKPVVIFTRSIDQASQDFLLTLNRQIGMMKFTVVQVAGKGSAGGARMNDIANILNVPLLSDWQSITVPDDLDVLPVTIKITECSFTMISEAHEERVKAVANDIKKAYDQLPLDTRRSAVGRMVLQRYDVLMGSSVTLYVGGVTDNEITERKDRYEDVTRACRSALKNGILQGCGYSLAMVADLLNAKYPEDDIALRFAKVLKTQLMLIMGLDKVPEDINAIEYVNLATGEVGNTPGELNIWDAALATTTALEAGVSTALQLINTSGIILGNRLGSVRIPGM